MTACQQLAENLLNSGRLVKNAYPQYPEIVELPDLRLSLIFKKPEFRQTIEQPYQITPSITSKYPFIYMPLCDWTILPPGTYKITIHLYYIPYSKVFLIDLHTKKVHIINSKSATLNIRGCSILAVYFGKVNITRTKQHITPYNTTSSTTPFQPANTTRTATNYHSVNTSHYQTPITSKEKKNHEIINELLISIIPSILSVVTAVTVIMLIKRLT